MGDEAVWALHARGLLDLATPQMTASRGDDRLWFSKDLMDLANALRSCAKAAPLDPRTAAPLLWASTAAAGIEDYDIVDLLRLQVEALVGNCEEGTCAADGRRSARSASSIRASLSRPSEQRARTLDSCADALRTLWDPRAARASPRYLPQQHERFSLFGAAMCLPCMAALHLLPASFGPDACGV